LTDSTSSGPLKSLTRLRSLVIDLEYAVDGYDSAAYLLRSVRAPDLETVVILGKEELPNDGTWHEMNGILSSSIFSKLTRVLIFRRQDAPEDTCQEQIDSLLADRSLPKSLQIQLDVLDHSDRKGDRIWKELIDSNFPDFSHDFLLF
jgi:hypothetical protein